MSADNVIQTYTEEIFCAFDPDESVINIVDIAHATALNCRFNGHIHEFYSVAQHCVHAAELLLAQYNSIELALAGLLHDASEAYIADLASPIKKGIVGYKQVEQKIQEAIYSKYKLPYTLPPQEVEEVDLRLLVTEARDLMPVSWLQRHGHKYKAAPYSHLRIEGWHWRKAEQRYLIMFEELTQALCRSTQTQPTF